MAESTADVRRDIELTRERMTSTLAQLERKLNLTQIIRDHPWPAIGAAVGAGLLLSGSGADVKAAGATALATRGASSRLGPALDDIVAQLMHGLGEAFQGHVDTLVGELKSALGAPPTGNGQRRSGLADTSADNDYAAASAHQGATSGGMSPSSSPSGTATNPWNTGDHGNLTPSSAGSQGMGGR